MVKAIIKYPISVKYEQDNRELLTGALFKSISFISCVTGTIESSQCVSTAGILITVICTLTALIDIYVYLWMKYNHRE